MDRRQLLFGIGGLVSTVGISGCLGDGSGEAETASPTPTPSFDVDPEAPARLKLLSVSFPDDLTYGDRFEGQITVANTGGEPIESDAAVALTRIASESGESQEAAVNADGLESGEARSHSIGQFDAEGAGEYRLEASDEFDAVNDEFDGLLTVAPQQVALDEQVTSPDDLRFTVTDVQYEDALMYPDSSGDMALRDTLSDRILLLPRITVENAGNAGIDVSAGVFSVEDGAAVTDIAAQHVEGPELRNAQVNPGESVEGWVAFAVPRENVGEFELGLHLASSSGPADVTVDLGANPGLPQFELADQALPSQFREGTQEFSFEIENTGEGAGTFRGVVQFMYTEDPGLFSTAEQGVWYAFEEGLTAEIPAGATRTVTQSTEYDGDMAIDYRLKPFDYEWTVEESS